MTTTTMSTTAARGLASPAPGEGDTAAAAARDCGAAPATSGSSPAPSWSVSLLFVYVPIGWSLWLSFFEARFTVTPDKFVGLDNYADMLTNGPFTGCLGPSRSSPRSSSRSPSPVAGLALLVHRIRFIRAFFRSVFFIPTACSYVVASMVWKLSIFNGVRFGLANTVLGWFGIEPSPGSAPPPRPGTGWCWSPLRLWLQPGFYMILFLAALQQIPEELYEAAWTDGARPGWQTFRHITLPQLRTTSVAVVLLLLIAAYQAFDEFYNLLPNTPAHGRRWSTSTTRPSGRARTSATAAPGRWSRRL